MNAPDPLAWENLRPDVVHDHRSKTHTAQITLAEVPEGWTFSASCSRLTGDVAGWGEGLGRRAGNIRPDRLAETQAEALAGACAVIRSRLPDRPLSDWMDSLMTPEPAQPDLFSAGADQ